MEKQNDSLTADSLAYLEAQGIPTDDEDEDDIHFCKKCKQVFNKIEAYLEHKVKHDKFKVAYNRAPGDKRMVLPTLTKKEQAEKPTTPDGQTGNIEQPDAPSKPTRKRRKKKSPPVDIQLITERNTYICTKCDRKFSREATLKWHIEYDHKQEADSDEEDEEEKDVEAMVKEESQDASFVMKREPAVKRAKVDDDTERPFSCEICGVSFKEVAVLKTHMLTHSTVRQYKCTYDNCPYAFKTKGSLVRHTRRHTGERPYSCEACGRKFAESGALTRHMRSRNPCSSKTDADLPRYGKKWTYVPNIPAVVSDEKSNDNFISMVPGEMVMVMTEGENGEQILTEAQVVSNNETVSSLGENLMEEGEVSESEVGELVSASNMQALTTTQCRVCKEECLDGVALRAHLRLHLADFPFHCGLCHFTTEQRDDLRSHMQSKHLRQLKGIDPNILLPPADSGMSKENSQHTAKDNTEAQTAVKQLLEMPSFVSADSDLTETLSARAVSRCPICNRAFRGTSYLKQHMKSHTGDRPYECPACHKSFVTKDALNKHLIVHTDERNFKCGECGKLFKRIGHVREHLKIHNSDRPFPCTACDKSFKTNNALKVHRRTHSDFYPYECRTCHRHFREKGSLQRHLRTHTGERPFRCPRCGRGFAEHGTLNRHLKAKVQCNYHLGYQAVEGEEQSQEMEIHEEEEEEQENSADIPTVLAEFSSVVADTQQYIVAADSLSDGETQTTEYVVLHTDLATEDIHNVEIVTEGDIDPNTILSTVAGNQNSYVVVSESGNHLRIIDSSTGITLATMPTNPQDMPAVAMEPDDSSETTKAGTVTLETGSSISVVTESNEPDASGDGARVKLENGSEVFLSTSDPAETITVHDTDGAELVGGAILGQMDSVVTISADATESLQAGEVSSVTDDALNSHAPVVTGTVAVHTDQSIPITDTMTVRIQGPSGIADSISADASSVPDTIIIHADACHITETTSVQAAAGPITVVGGDREVENVADAVKHAMIVADVIESGGVEDDAVRELQVALVHVDGDGEGRVTANNNATTPSM